MPGRFGVRHSDFDAPGLDRDPQGLGEATQARADGRVVLERKAAADDPSLFPADYGQGTILTPITSDLAFASVSRCRIRWRSTRDGKWIGSASNRCNASQK